MASSGNCPALNVRPDKMFGNEANNKINQKNVEGSTPLHHAASAQHIRITKLLLENGADVSARNKNLQTPLHLLIARNANKSYMRRYRKSKILPRDNKVENHNAYYSIFPVIKEIIDPYSTRKLHKKIDYDVMELLLDAGADTNARDASGCAPIHLAVYTGEVKLAKILLDRGADVNAVNQLGTTALHHAVLHKCQAMIELLLRSGADLALRTAEGDTALHWAVSIAEDGDKLALDIVTCLIEHGADVNVKNNEGMNILDKAVFRGQEELADSICEYVAEFEVKNELQLFDQYNLDLIYADREMYAIYVDCKRTLLKMKNTFIGNSSVTFYALLMDPMEKLLVYAKDPDFCRGFHASDYINLFPKYESILRNRFVKAVIKNKVSGSVTL